MRPIRTFSVVPSLPAELAPLRVLAYNLWWSWDHEAVDLFRRLDEDLWEATGHNVVKMLGSIPQERLEAAARDQGFMAHLQRVMSRLEQFLHPASTWYQHVTRAGDGAPALPAGQCIAYYSMEFGISECLPNYSGGLGMLSGDHLKSASDLGLPLVGVGLLYQEGYFRQYLNVDGWQNERYPHNDFYNMPTKLVRDEETGEPLTVSVVYPGRLLTARIWRVDVGRVPLFLLDTNVPGNAREDQDVTDRLYGGDLDMRLRQEVLLGIGGTQALRVLGYNPAVYHLNEGHAAFLGLERIRLLRHDLGISFAEAREVAAAGHLFTTHTPVPAGIDRFPPEMVDRYFEHDYANLGLTRKEFLALGRENPASEQEPFSMAVLALRLSARANGVSQLHSEVARRMWRNLWPGVPTEDVPITAVTNGVHIRSWVSRDLASLFDRYLGPGWQENPADPRVWAEVQDIPPAELWRTHERRRERLVAFARARLRQQLEQRGASASEIAAAAEVLHPEALTIGFARRFATYKRATLIFRDRERLARLVSDFQRPVQFVFAGKAHPHDQPGKELIREVVHIAQQPEFRQRMLFLEDYDVVVARYLLSGCDVWLNTPVRPQEASGTSGMKAAANGVLNCSTVDGWWCEGNAPEAGWSIGRGEEYADKDYQNHVEANAFYNLLEKEIIPIFYHRGLDGIPRGWIAHMKASIARIAPYFNTHRMVAEYAGRFYLPMARRALEMGADQGARARALAAWKGRVRGEWGNVRVLEVNTKDGESLAVGSALPVGASVQLGGLSPDDVAVQIYHGRVNEHLEISDPEALPMRCDGRAAGPGTCRFVGKIPCCTSGQHGFALRVVPHHPDLADPFEMGLISWS
ncbi:MAG: alpha-glucan family phosphorylase [Armatimonadetes bacterium]|nr:alpha-glucan family phosphorylase [Armatimonadota bacterium]